MSDDFATRPREKIAIFVFGIVFVAGMLLIALYVKEPTPFQLFVFRVVLALAAAGVAALIPGFLDIKSKVWKNTIRAGGALAVFAIVYLINPPQLVVVRPVPPPTVIREGPSLENAPPDVSGLEFHEVPPEKLGLSKPINMFTVDFGTNKRTFPADMLKQRIPFEQISGVGFTGTIPLSIYFDKNDEIKVSATIYDASKHVVAKIENSEWAIVGSGWDRNWDAIAFEIVDENRIPIFQIERPLINEIKIRGIFHTSGGDTLVSTDEGIFVNQGATFVPAPRRLFAYPKSSKFT